MPRDSCWPPARLSPHKEVKEGAILRSPKALGYFEVTSDCRFLVALAILFTSKRKKPSDKPGKPTPYLTGSH